VLYWKKRADMALSTWRGFSFLDSFCLASCSSWLDLMRASFGEIIFLATANLRVFFAFPMVVVSYCVFVFGFS